MAFFRLLHASDFHVAHIPFSPGFSAGTWNAITAQDPPAHFKLHRYQYSPRGNAGFQKLNSVTLPTYIT